MSYGVFAEFYDGLTRNVDYKAKADYLCRLFERFAHEPGCTLDLACGTGSLTVEFKKRGIDVFGADMSSEMLTEAQMKAADEELDILFLKQKMQSLTLYGTIDTCVCTLDSISHLQGAREVQKTFDRVAYYMEQGGLFVFDVNTVYKHKEILGGNTFVYDTDEVFCVWQNTYSGEQHKVKIELDFFIPEEDHYIRERECFSEYAYAEEDIISMLENSGFETLAVYRDMTFEQPCEDTQRITFAARKK